MIGSRSFLLAFSVAVFAPVSAAQCVGVFADDFSGSALGPVWAAPSGSCGTIALQNGALVMAKSGGCVGVIGLDMDATAAVACGDFEVTVDYSLAGFAAPAPGSWRHCSLRVLLASDRTHVASIDRFSETPGNPCVPAPHNYKAFTTDPNPCQATMIPTNAMAGRLRIARAGTTVTMYYDEGAGWQVARTDSAPLAPVIIRLDTGTGGSDGSAHQVTLDDFDLQAQSWFDLGHGKPGGGSVAPVVVGSGPLAAGTQSAVDLSGAAPGAPALLVIGFTRADLPLKGGILVPSPAVTTFLLAGAQGEHAFPFALPAGLPPGIRLYFQYWIVDAAAMRGCSASNGLEGIAR